MSSASRAAGLSPTSGAASERGLSPARGQKKMKLPAGPGICASRLSSESSQMESSSPGRRLQDRVPATASDCSLADASWPADPLSRRDSEDGAPPQLPCACLASRFGAKCPPSASLSLKDREQLWQVVDTLRGVRSRGFSADAFRAAAETLGERKGPLRRDRSGVPPDDESPSLDGEAPEGRAAGKDSAGGEERSAWTNPTLFCSLFLSLRSFSTRRAGDNAEGCERVAEVDTIRHADIPQREAHGGRSFALNSSRCEAGCQESKSTLRSSEEPPAAGSAERSTNRRCEGRLEEAVQAPGPRPEDASASDLLSACREFNSGFESLVELSTSLQAPVQDERDFAAASGKDAEERGTLPRQPEDDSVEKDGRTQHTSLVHCLFCRSLPGSRGGCHHGEAEAEERHPGQAGTWCICRGRRALVSLFSCSPKSSNSSRAVSCPSSSSSCRLPRPLSDSASASARRSSCASSFRVSPSSPATALALAGAVAFFAAVAERLPALLCALSPSVSLLLAALRHSLASLELPTPWRPSVAQTGARPPLSCLPASGEVVALLAALLPAVSCTLVDAALLLSSPCSLGSCAAARRARESEEPEDPHDAAAHARDACTAGGVADEGPVSAQAGEVFLALGALQSELFAETVQTALLALYFSHTAKPEGELRALERLVDVAAAIAAGAFQGPRTVEEGLGGGVEFAAQCVNEGAWGCGILPPPCESEGYRLLCERKRCLAEALCGGEGLSREESRQGSSFLSRGPSLLAALIRQASAAARPHSSRRPALTLYAHVREDLSPLPPSSFSHLSFSRVSFPPSFSARSPCASLPRSAVGDACAGSRAAEALLQAHAWGVSQTLLYSLFSGACLHSSALERHPRALEGTWRRLFALVRLRLSAGSRSLPFFCGRTSPPFPPQGSLASLSSCRSPAEASPASAASALASAASAASSARFPSLPVSSDSRVGPFEARVECLRSSAFDFCLCLRDDLRHPLSSFCHPLAGLPPSRVEREDSLAGLLSYFVRSLAGEATRGEAPLESLPSFLSLLLLRLAAQHLARVASLLVSLLPRAPRASRLRRSPEGQTHEKEGWLAPSGGAEKTSACGPGEAKHAAIDISEDGMKDELHRVSQLFCFYADTLMSLYRGQSLGGSRADLPLSLSLLLEHAQQACRGRRQGGCVSFDAERAFFAPKRMRSSAGEAPGSLRAPRSGDSGQSAERPSSSSLSNARAKKPRGDRERASAEEVGDATAEELRDVWLDGVSTACGAPLPSPEEAGAPRSLFAFHASTAFRRFLRAWIKLEALAVSPDLKTFLRDCMHASSPARSGVSPSSPQSFARAPSSRGDSAAWTPSAENDPMRGYAGRASPPRLASSRASSSSESVGLLSAAQLSGGRALDSERAAEDRGSRVTCDTLTSGARACLLCFLACGSPAEREAFRRELRGLGPREGVPAHHVDGLFLKLIFQVPSFLAQTEGPSQRAREGREAPHGGAVERENEDGHEGEEVEAARSADGGSSDINKTQPSDEGESAEARELTWSDAEGDVETGDAREGKRQAMKAHKGAGRFLSDAARESGWESSGASLLSTQGRAVLYAVRTLEQWALTHPFECREKSALLAPPKSSSASWSASASALSGWAQEGKVFFPLAASAPLHQTAAWLLQASLALLGGAEADASREERRGATRRRNTDAEEACSPRSERKGCRVAAAALLRRFFGWSASPHPALQALAIKLWRLVGLLAMRRPAVSPVSLSRPPSGAPGAEAASQTEAPGRGGAGAAGTGSRPPARRSPLGAAAASLLDALFLLATRPPPGGSTLPGFERQDAAGRAKAPDGPHGDAESLSPLLSQFAPSVGQTQLLSCLGAALAKASDTARMELLASRLLPYAQRTVSSVKETGAQPFLPGAEAETGGTRGAGTQQAQGLGECAVAADTSALMLLEILANIPASLLTREPQSVAKIGCFETSAPARMPCDRLSERDSLESLSREGAKGASTLLGCMDSLLEALLEVAFERAVSQQSKRSESEDGGRGPSPGVQQKIDAALRQVAREETLRRLQVSASLSSASASNGSASAASEGAMAVERLDETDTRTPLATGNGVAAESVSPAAEAQATEAVRRLFNAEDLREALRGVSTPDVDEERIAVELVCRFCVSVLAWGEGGSLAALVVAQHSVELASFLEHYLCCPAHFARGVFSQGSCGNPREEAEGGTPVALLFAAALAVCCCACVEEGESRLGAEKQRQIAEGREGNLPGNEETAEVRRSRERLVWVIEGSLNSMLRRSPAFILRVLINAVVFVGTRVPSCPFLSRLLDAAATSVARLETSLPALPRRVLLTCIAAIRDERGGAESTPLPPGRQVGAGVRTPPSPSGDARRGPKSGQAGEAGHARRAGLQGEGAAPAERWRQEETDTEGGDRLQRVLREAEATLRRGIPRSWYEETPAASEKSEREARHDVFAKDDCEKGGQRKTRGKHGEERARGWRDSAGDSSDSSAERGKTRRREASLRGDFLRSVFTRLRETARVIESRDGAAATELRDCLALLHDELLAGPL
ncbi:hypothetical protein BESB_073050 [Besnoitia besnoiti]|uniref:Uncharacterized protein n=1 Tax=Besnoitia besnoiti TaxID=94643 RepID=A0A2A9MEQ3_BESBE|nr:uncharacterized protein BESB_073050 [Besnoitia besnoiti]PFH34153.1 hypothetical protein BESB_073050 [Besnoitia besnoiti]